MILVNSFMKTSLSLNFTLPNLIHYTIILWDFLGFSWPINKIVWPKTGTLFLNIKNKIGIITDNPPVV